MEFSRGWRVQNIFLRDIFRVKVYAPPPWFDSSEGYAFHAEVLNSIKSIDRQQRSIIKVIFIRS